MYYAIGASVSTLHRESTDSPIEREGGREGRREGKREGEGENEGERSV